MLGPDGDLVILRPHHLAVIPSLLVGDQTSLFEDVIEGILTTMSCRALISPDTFLQQLTICLALRGSPVLLHQHFDSGFILVIISFLLPTQRRFSRISRITFIVLMEQFKVLQVFFNSPMSIAPWLAMIFFKNAEDLFLRTRQRSEYPQGPRLLQSHQ